MLNRFYYLNNGDDPVSGDALTAAGAGITVIQPLKLGSASANRLLDRQYSANGNFRFCLGVHGKGKELLVQARQTLLLFFHPFYDTGEHGKPLFAFAPHEQVDSIRVALLELFWRQRLAVELIVVDEKHENLLLLDTRSGDPACAYYDYCVSTYRAGDVVLVKGPGIGSMVRDLRLVEEKLRQQHPDFYEMADAGRQMSGTIARLSHQNGIYREENAILQELLDLTVKHDEVNHILRFYRNEYEILPLWYKRFGHIIKVLQGKRSFRSLYDKRIKKYKD